MADVALSLDQENTELRRLIETLREELGRQRETTTALKQRVEELETLFRRVKKLEDSCQSEAGAKIDVGTKLVESGRYEMHKVSG